MGFKLDPQQCLEEVGGDLLLMGCSFFLLGGQHSVEPIFLEVPNFITEDKVKETMDVVL
jgi:hypothetical protein